MALTPSTTVFPPVNEGQNFSQTVTYSDEEGTGDPLTVESVTSSIQDSTINISFENDTVTISGSYNNAFPGKTFKYIPLGQPGTLLTVPFNQIPAKIDALTGYNPVGTLSTTVIYTVVTSAGSATITQVVNNNWDAGKAQMLNALSRGQY